VPSRVSHSIVIPAGKAARNGPHCNAPPDENPPVAFNCVTSTPGSNSPGHKPDRAIWMAIDVTRHPALLTVKELPPRLKADQGCPNCVHVCHGPEYTM
jgi:hypothetical protein